MFEDCEMVDTITVHYYLSGDDPLYGETAFIHFSGAWIGL